MNKNILIILFWILVVGVGIYIYKNIDFKDLNSIDNIVIDLPPKDVTINKINIEETLIGTWYKCGIEGMKIVFFNDKSGFLSYPRFEYHDLFNVEEKFEWKYQDNILYIFPENQYIDIGELNLSFEDDNSFYLTDERDKDSRWDDNSLYQPFSNDIYNKKCP